MLNQIILVGRLTRDINVHKSDKGVKVATISLAIPRSFKNMDGNYDTDFVDCVAFDAIAEALAAGDKIQLVGFGTFEVRERAARECINPQTKAKVKVPASKVPAFKAGQALKNIVK